MTGQDHAKADVNFSEDSALCNREFFIYCLAPRRPVGGMESVKHAKRAMHCCTALSYATVQFRTEGCCRRRPSDARRSPRICLRAFVETTLHWHSSVPF